FAEAVADAADRLDQVAGAELAPQRLDVDVDGPLQHDGALADGGVHELVARQGPARLAQQAVQQAELRRSQLQLPAPRVGPVADAVDADAQVLDGVARLGAPLQAA